MSTNFVHVLTVIGKAASKVESACDELLGRRVERDAGSFGSDDWSMRDHRDLAGLCEALIGQAERLPILYAARYLDGWSSGGLRALLLEWPDARRRLILGGGYDLAYYPSRDRNATLAQIRVLGRTKAARENHEERWHLGHLKDAIESALWLDVPFLVVTICQNLGPTRHVEDIEAAAGADRPGRMRVTRLAIPRREKVGRYLQASPSIASSWLG